MKRSELKAVLKDAGFVNVTMTGAKRQLFVTDASGRRVFGFPVASHSPLDVTDRSKNIKCQVTEVLAKLAELGVTHSLTWLTSDALASDLRSKDKLLASLAIVRYRKYGFDTNYDPGYETSWLVVDFKV